MDRNTNLRTNRWTATRLWAQQPCVIMASGPSMSAAVAAKIQSAWRYRVIVINNTFLLAPWADLLYAADANWWDVYHSQTATFGGLKVTCSEVRFADVLRLRSTGREGFDADPSCLRNGGNSGYQAIHLAAHLGCHRILLCGFDMRGGHWHERHEVPLREHGEAIYARWIARFATLAPALEERGIEVVNCTPGSALRQWPYQPLEEALRETRAVSYS